MGPDYFFLASLLVDHRTTRDPLGRCFRAAFTLDFRPQGRAPMELKDVWTAAAVLMGFQLTGFAWRLAREMEVDQAGGVNWVPPADYLNLASLVATAFGVFVLPITGLISPDVAECVFGFAVVLFAGYPFALLAHYSLLFNRGTRLPGKYSTKQERLVVASTILAAVLYLLAWSLKV